MNKQPEDLLEEFPTRRNQSLTLFSVSNCLQDSSSSGHFSSDDESLENGAKSTIDPMCTAMIAADSTEFRKLQKEIRKSNMLTGAGTQQLLLKNYIETQGRKIAKLQDQDFPFRKVKNTVAEQEKCLKPLKHTKNMRIGIGRRLTNLVYMKGLDDVNSTQISPITNVAELVFKNIEDNY